MDRHAYPSDLSDAEFARLRPYLPEPKRCGRPWLHPRRAILDAIFYVVRTGCQWRALPREYPPWSTVHYWFRRWRLDGTWERWNRVLREQLRVRVGRDPQPSAAIVDSQSVKTTGVGGVRGYDGAKKLSGRKRHVAVDTLGWLLKAKVHAADLQDRAAVPLLLEGIAALFPRLAHAWVDQGYTGAGAQWIAEHLGWSVEVVRHPPKARGEWVPLGTGDDPRPFEWRRLPPERTGFRGVLPRRWIVETTQPQDPPNARLDERERAVHARCGGAARVGRPGREQARRADRAVRGRGRTMSGLAVVAGPPRLRWSGARVGGSGSRRPTASACWGCSAA